MGSKLLCKKHIGWNSLSFPQKGRLFEGFSREPYVYFVHSYYLKAEEDIVTARTEYGVSIDASVEKGNLFACQFHPEKSSGSSSSARGWTRPGWKKT